MKTMIGLALALALSGCGKGVYGPTQIDPAFGSYIKTFETEAASRGKDIAVRGLTIRFGTLSGGVDGGRDGECNIGAGGREIVIDPTYWAAQPEAGREVLLFHELGHCVLNRAHKTEKVFSGSGFESASIMAPTILSASQYDPERGSLLDELFN